MFQQQQNIPCSNSVACGILVAMPTKLKENQLAFIYELPELEN